MPNILITGTPGTGKSSIARCVAVQCPYMKLIEVGELAKTERCFDGWDDTRKCHILDEDRLLDIMEDLPAVKNRRSIIDYHGAEMFPERWIDGVFVVRTNNTSLYTRLEARSYSEDKIKENVEAEIFQILLDEAREAYPSVPVEELQNNTNEELERNVQIIVEWLNGFQQQ